MIPILLVKVHFFSPIKHYKRKIIRDDDSYIKVDAWKSVFIFRCGWGKAASWNSFQHLADVASDSSGEETEGRG